VLERLTRSSASRPENVKGGRRTDAASPIRVDASAFQLEMTPLLEQLQGEWSAVSVVTNGQALPPAMLAFGSRTMTGNEMQVVFGGQVMVHAKVKVDESRTPIEVDYLNIGRGPAAVTLGILELHDDVIRVCMGQPGAPRPDDFTSKPGSGRTFSEWKKK
jgi:uncharacterized protein (TIGR03067 family)